MPVPVALIEILPLSEPTHKGSIEVTVTILGGIDQPLRLNTIVRINKLKSFRISLSNDAVIHQEVALIVKNLVLTKIQ